MTAPLDDSMQQKGWVLNSFLNPDTMGSSPARMIAVSLYPAQHPTFTFLIDGLWLFSDLPISAFHIGKQEPCYGYKDSCCGAKVAGISSPVADVHILPRLDAVSWLTPCDGFVHQGQYLFTIDMVNGNQNWNVCNGDRGVFLVPNHKLIIGTHTKIEFPKWIKPQTAWK